MQTHVQAVFFETLRRFPAATVLPKFAVHDTMIPTAPVDYNTPGANIYVPKWTEVCINTVALHRNRKYWGQDVDVFRPERVIDTPDGSYRWPRDAFLGFSAGNRLCLGQKFATGVFFLLLSLLFHPVY